MLPLSGLRIIAVEQYGAGPYGSMQLADLGAEVWKIENPAEGGDMARRVGPFFAGPEDSHFFHSFNRNKKSLTLDLKKPGARRVLHALVARADGVIDNLRGDLPEKLGLTYAALAPANRRIVCSHLSAYGGFAFAKKQRSDRARAGRRARSRDSLRQPRRKATRTPEVVERVNQLAMMIQKSTSTPKFLKIDSRLKGQEGPAKNFKSIIRMTDKEVFPSIIAAAEDNLGINTPGKSSIRRSCLTGRMCHGHVFMFHTEWLSAGKPDTHPRRKAPLLTAEQIRKIIVDDRRHALIAKDYGISVSYVSAVKIRKGGTI